MKHIDKKMRRQAMALKRRGTMFAQGAICGCCGQFVNGSHLCPLLDDYMRGGETEASTDMVRSSDMGMYRRVVGCRRS